jgi:hypothetical protein
METNVKPHYPKQGLKPITFPWENAPSHMGKVTIAKISELGMSQIPHPPYSPDIVPSDFFLFGDLKHKFQRCFYDSADEPFSVITDLMENLENRFSVASSMSGSCVFILLWKLVESISKHSKKICHSPSSLSKRTSTNFRALLY